MSYSRAKIFSLKLGEPSIDRFPLRRRSVAPAYYTASEPAITSNVNKTIMRRDNQILHGRLGRRHPARQKPSRAARDDFSPPGMPIVWTSAKERARARMSQQ